MKSTLNKAIKLVQAKDSDAKELFAQLTTVREEASRDWSAIRQRIQNGETTGDQLADFAILKYSFYFVEAIDAHHDLEKQLAKYQGQFVMLVKKVQEQIYWREGGNDRPSDFISRIRVEIGVIKGNSFVYNKDELQFYFPTGGKHIAYSESFSATGVQVKKVPTDLGCGFLDEIVLKNHTELFIAWGDQNVIEWFQKHCDEHWLKVFRMINLSLEKIVEFNELQAFLKKRQTELREAYQIANAEETFFKLKISGVKESDRDYKLNEAEARLAAISTEKETIFNEAKALGLELPLV